MDILIGDIKHGVRLLWRSPAFAMIVILALALGIGANTAVFSVMNAVLLKPLPYPDPGHIVSIASRFTGIGIPDDRNQFSGPEFMELRRFTTAFSEVSAVQGTSYNIRVGETPERISGALVSANFFRMLGVNAPIGRTFSDEEEKLGNENVVVLGHGLWKRRFASDPNVIGRAIEVSGCQATIIGVAAGGFEFPNLAEMWSPLRPTPTSHSHLELSANDLYSANGFEDLEAFAPELSAEA